MRGGFAYCSRASAAERFSHPALPKVTMLTSAEVIVSQVGAAWLMIGPSPARIGR
jgi:hypothetical protein